MILWWSCGLLALEWLLLEFVSGNVTALAAGTPSVGNMRQKRSEPISFPLHRRTSPNVSERSRSAEEQKTIRQHDLARQGALLSQLKRLQDERTSDSRKNRRAGWETLAMSSYNQDTFYYATIQIGTPPQAFDVNLDTGSSDLWVQSVTCRSCNLSLAQPYLDNTRNGFDATESSTYDGTRDRVQLNYGDGSALIGTISTDVVSVGQFSVPQQAFILATQQNRDFGIAGIMGLGWPSIAQSGGDPWWWNALSEFQQPEMSFYFSQWNVSPSDVAAPGGQFTIGGRNTSLFTGDVGFVSLSSQDYWSVQLQSLIVDDSGGSRTLALSGADYTSVIVDTGTTLMYGPTDVVDSVFQGIAGALRGQTIDPRLRGYWVLPCASTANIQFQFTSSVTVTVPASNVMFVDIGNLRPGYCTASLLSSLSTFGLRRQLPLPISTPAWILGSSFLRSTYTIFRKGNAGEQPSIGFAPLSGVNYQADGNTILGTNGNGVDGRIGEAGVIITGSGDVSGSGGDSTGTQGADQGRQTTTAGANSPTGTNSAGSGTPSGRWEPSLLSMAVLLAFFTVGPGGW